MVAVSIRMTGFVAALDAVKAVGEAGKLVNGPLATFASRLPYARGIETGTRRKAGGSFAFRDGVAATAAQAPAILGPAIPKGPAAVGQAKRKLRDVGIAEIKKRQVVKSGALRDSTQVLERPL